MIQILRWLLVFAIVFALCVSGSVLQVLASDVDPDSTFAAIIDSQADNKESESTQTAVPDDPGRGGGEDLPENAAESEAGASAEATTGGSAEGPAESTVASTAEGSATPPSTFVRSAKPLREKPPKEDPEPTEDTSSTHIYNKSEHGNSTKAPFDGQNIVVVIDGVSYPFHSSGSGTWKSAGPIGEWKLTDDQAIDIII